MVRILMVTMLAFLGIFAGCASRANNQLSSAKPASEEKVRFNVDDSEEEDENGWSVFPDMP